MDEEVAMDEYEPTDQEHNSGPPLLQDIWEKIIWYLPREDQNNVALVCKPLHSFVSYVQDKTSISLVFGDRRNFKTGVEIQDLEEFKKRLQGPQFVYNVSICKNRNSLKALYMLFEFRSVCQNLERLEVELNIDFEAIRIIKVPTFSNLKRLKLVNLDYACSMINQFLTNSPQLKDLCVSLAHINECQFLSVLPTSIKRLECDLTSNKSLENLILGIENGVVLEKLILHFVYFSHYSIMDGKSPSDRTKRRSNPLYRRSGVAAKSRAYLQYLSNKSSDKDTSDDDRNYQKEATHLCTSENQESQSHTSLQFDEHDDSEPDSVMEDFDMDMEVHEIQHMEAFHEDYQERNSKDDRQIHNHFREDDSDEDSLNNSESPTPQPAPTTQNEYPFLKLDLDKDVSAHVKVGDLLMLLLSHYVRFSVSNVELQNLLDMINLIFGACVLPASVHLLKQLFASSLDTIQYHIFCDYCFKFVMTTTQSTAHSNEEVPCPHCSKTVTINLKLNSYFLTLDVVSQIKAIYELYNIVDLIDKIQQQDLSTIADVTSGELYKRNILGENRTGSYTFNIDAAAMFNTTRKSLTPIQISLNELPVEARAKNIVYAGFWYGVGEPKMELFLEQFCKQAQTLATRGVDVDIGEESYNIKVKPLCCAVDSVARAHIMNMKQFNGYCSCAWCLHPGERIDGCIRFLYIDAVRSRSNEDYINASLEATSTGAVVEGVKGTSHVILLPDFAAVDGFSVDYLHGICIGAPKAITEAWLTRHQEPYYIGRPAKLNFINNTLKKIEVPNEIHRLPQKITDRSVWKASEWRNWLLMYSLVCVMGILPAVYVNHWSLLVTAVTILLGDNISESDLDQCQRLLEEFVCTAETLYGQSFMTYNMHILLHLTNSVRNCGPLWSVSTFPFESELFRIKLMVHSGKGVLLQLSQKIVIRSRLPTLIKFLTLKPLIRDKVFHLIGKDPMTKILCTCVYLNELYSELSTEESQLILSYNIPLDNLKFCQSVKCGKTFFQSYLFNRKFKNCLVHCKDDCHYLIEKIFKFGEEVKPENFYFIARKCHTETIDLGTRMPHIFEFNGLNRYLEIVKCDTVMFKSVFADVLLGEKTQSYLIDNTPCYEVQ